MLMRRNPKNYCLVCGERCRNSRSNLCKVHNLSLIMHKRGLLSISEMPESKGRHKFQSVRNHAHRVAESCEAEKVCSVCGYDTYVELCHIKPISSFPGSALLNEVNNPKNLTYLCPNHHKEQELGLRDDFCHIEVGSDSPFLTVASNVDMTRGG